MPWPDFSNGKQLVVLLRAVLVLSAICILSTFYFLHEPAKASTASLLETDPQCQIREVVKYVYIERRSASTNNSSASQNSSSSSTSETVLLDDRTPKRDVLPYDFPLPKNHKPYTRGEGSRMRFFQPIPVGEGHNAHGEERYPLWGSDHVDEATTLLEAQDGGRESNDPYDRPEDADALAVQGSIWHELITNFRNADIARLTADNSSALCLIASVYSGNCRYLDESFEQCVRRVGADSLDKVLPEKCRWGQYWKHIRDLTGSGSSQTPVLFGAVPQAELCSAGGPPSFVEPSRRDIAPFGPPRHCRNGALEYPIAFGTPRANVQKKLLPKLFDFHPVPLDAGPKPFSFNDEENYQALASMSHFCMTHSRGGWDCGRHYEVMGAGCVPYFYDIKAAGPYILPQLPKKLLMDIVSMPLFAHIGHATGANGDHYDLPDSPYIKRDSFNGRTRVRFVKEGFRFKEGVQLDKAWYWRTARKLLRYTQKYLTSEAMAAYVLKTMGAEDAKHVLILTRSAWDNLHQSFIAGLDALGVKMTIFATNNDRKLFGCFQSGAGGKALTSANLCERRGQAGRPGVHGNGVPWANRMQNADAIEYVNDWHVLNDRADKGFDAAIYTYYLEEGYPYGLFANVRENTNGKVAILDHDDSMGDPRRNGIYMAKEAYFFSRELRKTFC